MTFFFKTWGSGLCVILTPSKSQEEALTTVEKQIFYLRFRNPQFRKLFEIFTNKIMNYYIYEKIC